MVWGPYSENHSASVMIFLINICNQRVLTFLFLFHFFFFQRWAEVSTDDWRKFEIQACLEFLFRKSRKEILTDNPVKPLYFPSIEIQAMITELLEVTWNLLVLESRLELVSWLCSHSPFYYNHWNKLLFFLVGIL